MNDWRHSSTALGVSATGPETLIPSTQNSHANPRLRTVVLIDYQNMYRCARRAYGWEGQPGHYGNVKPIGLARCAGNNADRRLTQVRIYTGIPTPQRDRKGNAIANRRLARWVSDNPSLVHVFPRPLKYAAGEPREKGVDVELAIDLVQLAMDDEFDVAVVASADTDLLPPIKFVLERFPDKFVETVAFEPVKGCEADAAEPLEVPGTGVKVHARHKIRKHVFEKAIADRRNFVADNTDPDTIVGKPRWDRISSRFGS
jgi:hypothetical protein